MTLAEYSEKTRQEVPTPRGSEQPDTRKPSGPRRRPPIGELLRSLRRDRTLRETERDTGILNAYLSNIELGIKKPGL